MTTNLPWVLRCQLKADMAGALRDGDADLVFLCALALAGDTESLAHYQANYGGPDEVVIDG
jgi:hypothetical protein